VLCRSIERRAPRGRRSSAQVPVEDAVLEARILELWAVAAGAIGSAASSEASHHAAKPAWRAMAECELIINLQAERGSNQTRRRLAKRERAQLSLRESGWHRGDRVGDPSRISDPTVEPFYVHLHVRFRVA
jgi:hypothetical protein